MADNSKWRFRYDCARELFNREEQDFFNISRPNQTIIRPLLVGICGSDLSKMAHKIEDPPLGHEWVGVVEQVGPEVVNFAVGELVTSVASLACGECQHCKSSQPENCKRRQLLGREDSVLSNQIAVDEHDLLKVPQNLSLNSITLLEVAYIGDCAFYQGKSLGMSQDSKIIIFGAGPIGLFTALSLRERGYNSHLIEVSPERIEAARQLGLTCTAFAQEMIERQLFGKCDVIFDCTGDSAGAGALKFLPIYAKMDASVIIVGKYHKATISEVDFGIKALKLTWVANHKKENFKRAIDYWSSKIEKYTDQFVTTFPMTEINEAFTAAKARKVLKVMLKQEEE